MEANEILGVFMSLLFILWIIWDYSEGDDDDGDGN